MSNQYFYVYAYLDPRKPGNYEYSGFRFNFEPMYIGKGYGYRSKWRYHKHNLYLMNKINKIKRCGLRIITVFIMRGLYEQMALNLEQELIAVVGRKDLEKGPLVNMTDGGEGTCGRPVPEKVLANFVKRGKEHYQYGKPRSADVRKKISNTLKGRKLPKEVCEKISKALTGKKLSLEHIQSLKDAVRPPATEENRKKRSMTMKGHKWSSETIEKRRAGIKQSWVGRKLKFPETNGTNSTKMKKRLGLCTMSVKCAEEV